MRKFLEDALAALLVAVTVVVMVAVPVAVVALCVGAVRWGFGL